MNIVSLISKVTGGNKVLNNVTGLFVGESSKKRQMGLGGVMILSVAYMFDYITYDVYEQMLGMCALWLGVAFSSKLSKLGDAMKDMKKK